MLTLDLNADLAEGSPLDAELMAIITSANLCAGLHAGGPAEIRKAADMARRHGVALGVHPGYDDRPNFGRREADEPPQLLGALLAYQIGAVQAVTRLAGLSVHYLKPHGALYNQACRDKRFASPVAAAALLHGLSVVGLPGSELEKACQQLKVPFVPEGFADRRYQPDGMLVPRSDPNALIHDPAEAVDQALRLLESGIQTLCIHGDTPEAVEFAQAIREALEDRGVELAAFV
jgi:UPF0271 protein